jgi:hypothetical protein
MHRMKTGGITLVCSFLLLVQLVFSSTHTYSASGHGANGRLPPNTCLHRCSKISLRVPLEITPLWSVDLRTLIQKMGCDKNTCQCNSIITQLDSTSATKAKNLLFEACQSKESPKSQVFTTFNNLGDKKKKIGKSLITLEFDDEEIESDFENLE